MRSLAFVLAALTLASAGCDPAKAYDVTVFLAGTQSLRLDWQVGDTARFFAEILYKNPAGSLDAPPTIRSTSVERPDLYEWSTGDSTIARLVVPGTVAMLAAGQTILRVKTASATAEYVLTVSPRR